MSSCCEAFLLNRLQMSMVNMLLAELKMEVNDDISAANKAASITPRRPVNSTTI